jgi:uncharacterized membrane protein (UPF0127 family)
MRFVEISNLNVPLTDPVRVRYCESFFCRLRGLTFRRVLARDEGLLLVQKRQNRSDAAIHMFFVWTDLAVIWIDEKIQVVDQQLVRSWRPFYIPRSPARYVLELAPERFSEFHIGDRLSFEETNLD